MAASCTLSEAALAATEAYLTQLRTELGNRDPLEVQEELPQVIERLIAGLDDAALRRPEAPGKWSILEVIQHLADTALIFGYRVRMILAHPEPRIESYDQDLWARALGYNRVDLRLALEQLRVIRAANLQLFRSLDDEQLARAGFHEERGMESVRRIIWMIAGHDIIHSKQIERIKRTHGW